MSVLKVKGVCKTLRGSSVLSDINFELEGGTVTGIIGENGSGKSMLFRVLSGLVEPTEGCVLYNGESLRKASPIIGLVMDDVSMYPELTGKKNLELLAEIRHQAGISFLMNQRMQLTQRGYIFSTKLSRRKLKEGRLFWCPVM